MMTERMIRIMATIMLVLVISIGFLVPKAAAQSDQYPKMAPVDQYLMEKNAEILLARSAMKRLSKERTGLSVWWKEAGWRSLTRLSFGTRR
jgi:hypothetical protein